MKSRSLQGTALFVVCGSRVRGRSGSLLKAGRWRVPREEAATQEQTPQPVSAPGEPKQLQRSTRPRAPAGGREGGTPRPEMSNFQWPIFNVQLVPGCNWTLDIENWTLIIPSMFSCSPTAPAPAHQRGCPSGRCSSHPCRWRASRCGRRSACGSCPWPGTGSSPPPCR